MQDHRSLEGRERRSRFRTRRAAVDHDRSAELVGECELRVEEDPLLAERSCAVVAVEAGLAHGDDPGTIEELAELVDRSASGVAAR